MRLWHKDLISVLPTSQLGGQWRELSAIAGDILNGQLKHGLVKCVLDYDGVEFLRYSRLVIAEKSKRKHKYSTAVLDKIIDASGAIGMSEEGWDIELYENWHNDRYLKQCYYNLQEKFDCGLITAEEWKLVDDLVRSKIMIVDEV